MTFALVIPKGKASHNEGFPTSEAPEIQQGTTEVYVSLQLLRELQLISYLFDFE